MKRYGYLQAIYMSFFSREIYRDVKQNWGGGVVFYLFLLLAICWAVMLFRFQPNINRNFTHLATVVAPQMPQLTIKDGQVSTPENKVYEIKDPEDNQTVAIIDTTGTTQNLDRAKPSVKALLTKDKIFYVADADTIKVTTLSPAINMVIEPDVIKEKVIKFVGWAWVFMYPFLLLFSFAYRLVQSIVYAVIGKIFAALSNNHLSYAEVLKLSMVSVTPAIILGTILDWFGVQFHFQLLLYFVLSMGYLIFAMGSNKNN